MLKISSNRSIQGLQCGNAISSKFLCGNRVEELCVFIFEFDPSNCGPLFPILFLPLADLEGETSGAA
jgi:hypothetical protein